ncbi:DUF1654 domain-containing protein [Pseudomonas japonica]|uniref:DUF1654 domain-containing protein n=1 Tax=Pseudomonas japonica TaxID=256466 RepID=UPI0015E2A04B|nr:DUF1654 domain-containing protein [Pseudomonas japonica]MBA1245459.1 DUF1654 domain-containing protein [Pseudomonas japonica]
MALPQPNPYDLLAIRLQRAINHPAAQHAKTALLERFEGGSDEAWEQIMEELGENDNVTLAYRDDGHLQIFWTVLQDD